MEFDGFIVVRVAPFRESKYKPMAFRTECAGINALPQILPKSRNTSAAPEQERMQGDNADERIALRFWTDDGQIGSNWC
jgi:hypothetical protein